MPQVKFNDASEFEFLFRNNGLLAVAGEDGADDKHSVEHVPMYDALAYPDAPYFMQITIENIVREAVEPILVGSKLLTTINYKNGQIISLPSMGAMYAADIDEGSEYPEKGLNFGAGARIATIGKSGLAFKFTEEMKRYSQYDVVAMYLREAGRALARHKEQKIFSMMSRVGVTTHDNVNPSNSIFGVTTGRNMSGAPNGGIVAENIFEAYGQVLMNGFTPDLVVCHPLSFVLFAMDPVMRAMALHTGQVNNWLAGSQPGLLNKDPFAKGALGGLGPNGIPAGTHPLSILNNPTPVNQYANLTGGLQLPSYLGLPLTVLVSPFVPFDPVTKLTDIFVVDSKNIGAIIVDELPTWESVPDKLRDIEKIKIRERYSIAPMNEGRAVGVIKNVKVAPNELVTPAMAFSPTVNAISRGSQLLNSNGTLH
jgi:hypothetical protein